MEIPKNPYKAAVILGFVKPELEEVLIGAIESLHKQTYTNFDIFVYDNSVKPDSLAKVKSLFPDVRIKKNSKNLGFAGGNNSVIREVLKDEAYKYIVLLNDDTNPEEEWLKFLIQRAQSDEAIGGVASKLLFYEEFVRIEGRTQTFNPKKLNNSPDDRNLGIKLYPGTRFTNSNYSKKFYREGCYGFEGEFTWTSGDFVIDLPIGLTKNIDKYILELNIEPNGISKNQSLEIKIGNFKETITLNPNKKTYTLEIPAETIKSISMNLIQNAGSGIAWNFDGYDIGNIQELNQVSSSAEIDRGQYEEIREVEMLCGAAALIKREVLKQVGLLDEYLFVYYEDSDLSLRIRKAGWKLMYEPKAIVRHMHASSSTENSPLFRYHIRKNKPAFVLKNFGIRPNVYVTYDNLRDTVKLFIEAAKYKFRNQHFNMLFKTNIKSLLKFGINIPSLLLKRFNIIKST